METQLDAKVAKKKCCPMWAKYLLGFVLLCVLYFLSFGPVRWLETRGYLKEHGRRTRIIAAFYRPLYWTYNHTPLHKPIEFYVRLWDKPKH